MRKLNCYVLASAIIICCAALRVHSQITPSIRISNGSVSGRVTLKGKPASGVIVALWADGAASSVESSFKSTTDDEGKYHLDNIPTGAYQITCFAPAFVVPGINKRRGSQTVLIKENESVEGLDFVLIPGGVITGKVTDARGRPVIEQNVILLPADPSSTPDQPAIPIHTSQTDDRGIYRIFGIPAGRYKVAVGQNEESFFMSVAKGRPSYRQTFYPRVSDPGKADVVEVTEGSETSNIDISLANVAETFSASGIVVDGEDGRPIPNVRFGLQMFGSAGGRSFMRTPATSNSRGEFKIEHLASGKYAVIVLPESDSAARAEPVNFDVTDQNVDGLIIRTSKGASLAGNVVLENTDNRAALSALMHLIIYAVIHNKGAFGDAEHSSTINSDGSFFLKGLETGTAYLFLGAPQNRNLLRGFRIARIERDGLVYAQGLTVKNGDQISGLRVIVNYGTATVHGIVKLENGTLPSGARVIIRVDNEGEIRSNIEPPSVDARGEFVLDGLSAGVYIFTATVLSATSPQSAFTGKLRVNVSDGIITTVVIPVEPNKGPGP